LSKGISKIKTKILIYDLGKIIFDEICARGLSNLYFDYSKAFLKLAVDNLVSDPEVFCLLQQLQGQTNSTYLHCLSVSLLSFLVAREIGLYSDEQQFDIALGGFYHDIGKVSVHLDKYPDVPGAHAKANVSASQDHSQKGFELLNSIDSISKEILSIILLHEDSPNQDIIKFDNGSFYPVYLVSVINQFCNLIAKEKHYALSYKSINQKLLSKSIDIDLETLCAIKTVFKNSQYNELNNIEYGGERWPRS